MHIAGTFIVCATTLGLALLSPRSAAPAWPTDPTVNVSLCDADGQQLRPKMVSDGAGGAIVTWWDGRGIAPGIYAQRISVDGVVLWTAEGVALCTLCTPTGDEEPVIVSDGAGGAIVAWQDARHGYPDNDIYSQRISAGGTVLWATDGVALCSAPGFQAMPVIASDGEGGAIAAWADSSGNGSHYGIFAQRVSATGEVLWPANGVALRTASYDSVAPSIVADGDGGAIVTWQDNRRGPSTFITYAQRISAAGAVRWTPEGVALCGGCTQWNTAIVADGEGGAIVAWEDSREGGSIYAQRILADGGLQWPRGGWPRDGVAVCTAVWGQYHPGITTDDASGAIVTWMDYRSQNSVIYAQRISADGVVQWTADGVPLSTGGAYYPRIMSGGGGGAIVTWNDHRGASPWDIYAQRISATGTVQWTADGVALCTADGTQWNPAGVSDGAGGAIVAWEDLRSASSYDIHAQRVDWGGLLGGGVPTNVPAAASLAFALDPVRPNPLHGSALTVRFTLAGGAAASLELLDVAGRRVVVREVGSLGAGRHTLDLGAGRDLAPGLYLVCLRQGANAQVTRVVALR